MDWHKLQLSLVFVERILNNAIYVQFRTTYWHSATGRWYAVFIEYCPLLWCLYFYKKFDNFSCRYDCTTCPVEQLLDDTRLIQLAYLKFLLHWSNRCKWRGIMYHRMLFVISMIRCTLDYRPVKRPKWIYNVLNMGSDYYWYTPLLR